MIKLISFKKSTVSIATGLAAMSLSSSVLAHTGHSHAQHDTLSGLLHSLTTHPLLFGVIGLTLVAAAYMSRN